MCLQTKVRVYGLRFELRRVNRLVKVMSALSKRLIITLEGAYRYPAPPSQVSYDPRGVAGGSVRKDGQALTEPGTKCFQLRQIWSQSDKASL